MSASIRKGVLITVTLLVVVIAVVVTVATSHSTPEQQFSRNVSKVVHDQGKSWDREVEEAALDLGRESCGQDRREFVTEVSDGHGVSVGVAISVYDNAQKFLCDGGAK